MTSAQTMRTYAPCRRSWTMLLALTAAWMVSCSTEPKLISPSALVSPYPQRQVWAVAPFTNESGISVVMGDRVADAFATEIQMIDGLDALPVNRVIAAMRRVNVQTIRTPAEALALLNALGADGLIVGTVTAYDPYQPPKFGAAIALFTTERMQAQVIDPRQLTRARTDTIAPGALPDTAPTAQAAGIYDASNHQTLVWLDEYAAGRSEPGSAFGKRIYTVRMDLFTQFAAHRLLHDLLAREQARLQPATATGSQAGTEPATSR